MSALTDRQAEILAMLRAGKTAPEIARELDISRNAVYQQIQRLRRHGILPADYTPTGAPKREQDQQPGARVLTQLIRDLSQQVSEDGEALDLSSPEPAQVAALALDQLRQVRDVLDELTRQISAYIPR